MFEPAEWQPEIERIQEIDRITEEFDVEELCEVTATPAQIDWQGMNDRQVRALCQMYGIPVGKRGRISQTVLEQLKQAA